jgi:hypothetical protein
MTARRFPPPWTIEELEACFVVKVANGQKLGYFEAEPRRDIPLTLVVMGHNTRKAELLDYKFLEDERPMARVSREMPHSSSSSSVIIGRSLSRRLTSAPLTPSVIVLSKSPSPFAQKRECHEVQRP